jgi:peptide/nickel transport system substrate-binding protein
MGVRSDLQLTSPFSNVRSTQGRLLDLMFEPLLGLDTKGNIQPNLAESWESSRDGRTYTFRLRKGVKFHNGQEMTAEDVKFAVDFVMNPKNAAAGFVEMAAVEKAETPDRYTVVLAMKKTVPSFLASLTALRSFPVVPKGSVKEGIHKIGEFPPGTGPFKFVEWQPRQKIVLERYDDYWGHKAFLDRLIFRPIRDDTIRFNALRTGEVDIVERAPLEWIQQIAGNKVKGILYAAASYAEFRGVEFNVAAPPFNNKKLRQAVAYAMDKKEILQAAHFGFGEVADQKYPKGHAWYFEGLPSITTDLDKARALLKEVGYKGEAVEFLVEPTGPRETEAAVLQAQLKRIGMNVKLTVLEAGAYRTRQRTGEYGFKFDSGGLYPDPYLAYLELKCEPDLKNRATNTTGYCDKEMDKLLEQAEREVQPDKRRAILSRVVAKIQDDLPELYIGYVPQFHPYRDHVKDFTTDSDANFRFWGGGLNHTWLQK